MTGVWSVHGCDDVDGASPLELERVESVLRELKEFLPADLQVVRVHDHVIERLGEELAADVFPEGRVALRADEAPLAGKGLDDALAFELGVGLGHRVAIDAQFLGQRADAGERLAGLDGARGGRHLHLVHELLVDRFPGLELSWNLMPTVI